MTPDRRKALSLVAGAALVSVMPIRAAANPRVVGILRSGTPSARFLSLPLAKLGWVEGRDVRYEIAVVEPDAPDVDEVASKLARSGAEVLVASGVSHILALRRATQSIPIVCGGISDPVAEGVARTVQEPGMNVTGLSYGLRESAMLQLGTLQALVPGLRRVTFVTLEASTRDRNAPEHETAARALGVGTELAKVKDASGFEKLLASLGSPATQAAWVVALPRDVTPRRAAEFAIARRLATHAGDVEWVREGLLLSYWLVHSNFIDRLAAIVDKVLRGMDPGRIPFELPDVTIFALNRATARAIGVKVPTDILLRATEVIG